MFEVNIYIETDSNGVRKMYRGYGAIVEFILKDGSPETRDIYGCQEATGNQINLIALNDALQILTKPCDVTIYMNNQYVSGSISTGRAEGWKNNGWQTIKGEYIANKEEWQQVMKLVNRHNIRFAKKDRHEYQKLLQSNIKNIRDKGIEWQQQRLPL